MIAWLAGAAVAVEPALERFQCDRCHDAGPVFAAAPAERSCVGCHRAILDGGWDDRVLPEDVARWKRHLHRLNEVPSLVALDQRVTRSWLVGWLQDPHDLRPGLPAEMPRLPLTPQDAEALADALGVEERVADGAAGDVDRGLRLIAERCTACHDGTDALAPELARIRERSWPAAVATWLDDPRAVKSDTRMPDPGLGPEECADVVAALFSGALVPAVRAVPPPAPLPERAVGWAEVDQRVFHEVCRHCHSDPVPMRGEGGPGNTGGFGYAGAGLDLSSYEAATARPDLLAPDAPDGLLAHLRARHAEVAGAPVAGVLGMPLGLPPLPPEDVALVEAWLRQGAPR